MLLRIFPVIVFFALSATAVADTNPPPATLKGHKCTLSCLVFSRDGKLLASGAKDGTVIVWDLAVRKPLVSISISVAPQFKQWTRPASGLIGSDICINSFNYL